MSPAAAAPPPAPGGGEAAQRPRPGRPREFGLYPAPPGPVGEHDRRRPGDPSARRLPREGGPCQHGLGPGGPAAAPGPRADRADRPDSLALEDPPRADEMDFQGGLPGPAAGG